MKLHYYLFIFSLFMGYFSISQTLIAHYPMNKTSEDVTGNHEHLKKPNCTYSYDGLYTKGVYSGGKDNGNFITTPSLHKLDFENFSISVKFKSDQTAKKMPIVILGRSCRMIGAYITEDGKFAIYGNNGNIFKKSAIPYATNKWYQVSITYNKSTKTASLYINGKKAVSTNISFESSCLTQWKYSNLDISTCDYSNGKMFKGTWKNLKIYNGFFIPDNHRDPFEDVTTSITIEWKKPIAKTSTKQSHYPIQIDIHANNKLSGIRLYQNQQLIKTLTNQQLQNKRSLSLKENILLHKGNNKIEIHVFAGNKDEKSSQEIHYHVANNITENKINNNLKTTVFSYNNLTPFSKRYTAYSAMICPTKDNGSYMGWKDKSGNVHVSKLNSSDKVTKDFSLGSSRKLYAITSDESGFMALLVNDKKGTKGNMNWAYLVKYNANGTKIFDKKLFGDNSFANEGNNAFDDWSTPRIVYTGTHYYVICGISRKWNDGVVHQGDILFIIDKQGNKVKNRPSQVNGKYVSTNGWSWGTSHSFQQRMVFDGDYVHIIAKGDAYPRGIAYKKVLENLKHANPKTKGGNIFKMSGPVGQNYVPLTLGDIEVAGNNQCVVSFATNENRKSYDVGFAFINKEGIPRVKWLTNTSHADENHVYMTPYGDHFFITWMSQNLKIGEKPKYMATVVDADGNFVLKPFILNAQFQSKNIIHESKWSAYDNAFSTYNYMTNDFISYQNGDIGWVYTEFETGILKIIRIKK